ncbi:DNA mismatch repair protein MutS [Aminobacter sp. MSH1]|uniref:MutS-related protein n=1 Tax=Aminobacter sp. MSH1 TaxID=374606 RepID=UPI000D35A4E1|nr:DNA mismatch repair protein MutS [Aminobacter sp. MSH1]AWC25218.1 DNA mismatch repair protein MutS [Aminobacter sp. MSH1]
MRALLLYKTHDFDAAAKLWINEAALSQDLELSTLLSAMAAGDSFVSDVARKVILTAAPVTADEILYRQAILSDCLREAATVRAIYAITVEALEREKKIHVGLFRDSPEAVLRRSVEVLEMFLSVLRRLRALVDQSAAAFRSDGFSTLFAMLRRELGDDYFARLVDHIERLKFPRGILMSVELGTGNKGKHYVLRRLAQPKGWLARLFDPQPEGHVLRLHPRDEAGARAFSELRDRGLALAAVAVAEAVDHMLSFFRLLRTELAFYTGCLNLHDTLARYGAPTSLPLPAEIGCRRFCSTDLYDACLALGLKRRIVGNDIAGEGWQLTVITGANQGGKSTFLRSVGLAQLMMQAGMFVAAAAYSAEIVSGVFTHYKREEDTSMRSGKFDEELARMSGLVDVISPHGLILFNESFASTNEREGSQIACEIVRALLEKNVKVFFVTHMFELADGLERQQDPRFLFLRAGRSATGERSFKLAEGPPLPTSYGLDLYEGIFGEEVKADVV